MTIEQCIGVLDDLWCYETSDVFSEEEIREALDKTIDVLEILSNTDDIIKSKYDCIIIEGYADVIDQMKEVFKEVKE